VPKRDIGPLTRSPRWPWPIGLAEASSRKTRRLEIDNKLKFRRLLNRQIRWFFALENIAGIDACQTMHIQKIGAITQKPASLGELSKLVDRGDLVAERQGGELFLLCREEVFAADHKATYLQLRDRCE